MKKEVKKRTDLLKLEARKEFLKDENRKTAIEKRHAKGYLTARENIANLCDGDSFLEYGSAIFAAQRTRYDNEYLIENTPADGLVTGIGDINGNHFKDSETKCAVLSYDFTVLAGTQGYMNHKKTERIFSIAKKSKLPIIFFLEGGGGRPGDVDVMPMVVGGLNLDTFAMYGKLSGKVPRIAIVNGYSFAGNAALAGCSDIIIATKSTSIGMAGPAMIEGGGLGKFHPKEIGPMSVQVPNGVVDILVENEKDAVEVAKQYLAYFQGSIEYKECNDQTALRDIVPENRRYAYDMNKIITTLADKNSVLNMRTSFGKSMITCFIRINGRPMGLIANNLKHLAGSLDRDSCDKVARFLQLCDAFGLPIVSLIDAPGFMVGPKTEEEALVRHASRLFIIGANIDVPIYSIVTRKAYGLGAMALAGGSFYESEFAVSWPSGEFGGMGIEGAVKLGFKNELAAIEDEKEREAMYQEMVGIAYEHGSAENTASLLEIDEVIDPIDTRKWIINANASYPEKSYKTRNGRYIDAW